MFTVGSKARCVAGLAAVFLLVNLVYFAAQRLWAPLAIPVTVGLASVVIIFLMRRWHVNPPRYDKELQNISAMISLVPTLRESWLPMGTWAMEPVHLLSLLEHWQIMDGEIIVECGSGVSTVLMGNLLRQKGRGHLYSIEDDDSWHSEMSTQIAVHRLGEQVTLVHAPLAPVTMGDAVASMWYSSEPIRTALSAVHHIDMLIVDGPKSVDDLVRFPALPFFFSRCGADTLIVLDDVNRRQEQLVLAKWQELYDLKLDVRRGAHRDQVYLRVSDTARNAQSRHSGG